MLRLISLSVVALALSKSTVNYSHKFVSQYVRQLRTERGMESQWVVAEKYAGEITLSQNRTLTVEPASLTDGDSMTYWKINVPPHQAVSISQSPSSPCGSSYGFSQSLESPDSDCTGCGDHPDTGRDKLFGGWEGEALVPSCVFQIAEQSDLYFWVTSSCAESLTIVLTPKPEICDITEMSIPGNGGNLSVPLTNRSNWVKFTYSTSTGKRLSLTRTTGDSSAYYANGDFASLFSSDTFLVAVPNWALFLYVPPSSTDQSTSFTFTVEDFKCRDPALDVEDGKSQHTYCTVPGPYAVDGEPSGELFAEAFLGLAAALGQPLGCLGSLACASLYPECDANNMKRQVCADGFCSSVMASCAESHGASVDDAEMAQCNEAVSSSNQATLDAKMSEMMEDHSWQPATPLTSVCGNDTLTPTELKSRYSAASQAFPVFLATLLATLFY